MQPFHVRSRSQSFAVSLLKAVLVAVVTLWIFGILHGGCGGPNPRTQTALDELARIAAACQDGARDVGHTAALEPGVGEAMLAARQAQCLADAQAYCTAHHLDCSTVLSQQGPPGATP